jgi:DNA-binding NtrC family response regulator
MDVTWRGAEADRTVHEELAEAGLRVVAAGGQATVLAGRTPDALVPAAGDGAWVGWSSASVSLAEALEATRRGAYAVLWSGDEGANARLVARLQELATPEALVPDEPHLVADSPAARAVLRRVAHAARTVVPVLLTGETGTGKEETARLIHRWSGRRGPWLPINCAAIPNELMESELFGHARGAFSGAVASVDGKLLAARGGTVFLDEIDDTPFSIQMKLLRVLEDGQVTRVGETTARPADFRLVAATNRDLLGLVAQDRFGRDLYERLAIVRIELAPLRARLEDIPALVRHFVQRFQDLHGLASRPYAIAPDALAALRAHPWPGNIRELRNVVFHALVEKRGGEEILLSDLPRLVEPRAAPGASALVEPARVGAAIDRGGFNLRREQESLERAALAHALERGGGSPARAARLLGEVGRGASSDPAGTVRAMMRRLGFPPARSREHATD